ncbi:trypsin-like serine protease [Aliikangiella sp. IMCC44359]|uniref:trypsin-like serine protease n=1 Tax=Aliikangiella sp. IMCC44359 TaxID=3459125 RepID=UPI00403AD32E
MLEQTQKKLTLSNNHKKTKLILAICSALSLNVFASSDLTSQSQGNGIDKKIVNGVETQPGSRTYQAMLVRNGRQWCGGTLIADNWILTAAHCVDNASTSTLTVRLNSHTVNSGTTHSVSKIVLHPQTSNDIALLKLTNPAASSLTRALLPTPELENTIAGPGTNVTVSGWGNTSNGGPSSNVLLEVDLPVLTTEQCRQELGSSIDERTVCGGGPDGKSACNGDSGGPYAIRHNGNVYSIGTVSWGRACKGATAFVRTTAFLDWINTEIGGTTPPPPPPPGGNVLKNGVPATGLSASQGKDVVYTMEVPRGATDIKFDISGGTGDADMYVKFGSAPTDSSYDCRPYKSGNTESCTGSQAGGTYHVRVKAYSAFSGVSLVGKYTDDGTPPPGNDPIVRTESVSVAQGEWSRFTQVLPAGYQDLKVSISGGTGDADLYVRKGTASTTSSYDCRPYKNGNTENCDFTNPDADTWHIDVRGYRAASGVTLNIKANPEK